MSSAVVNVADVDNKTLIVGGSLVRYDSNDQFTVTATPAIGATTMEVFEQTLKNDKSNNDTLVVGSYDPADSSDIATFSLTVVADV